MGDTKMRSKYITILGLFMTLTACGTESPPSSFNAEPNYNSQRLDLKYKQFQYVHDADSLVFDDKYTIEIQEQYIGKVVAAKAVILDIYSDEKKSLIATFETDDILERSYLELSVDIDLFSKIKELDIDKNSDVLIAFKAISIHPAASINRNEAFSSTYDIKGILMNIDNAKITYKADDFVKVIQK